MRWSVRLAAVAASLAVLAWSCGGGGPDTAAPSTPASTTSSSSTAPSRTVTTATGDTRVCSAPEAGYRLRFPDDWYVNDPVAAPPCRFFHPEPFELPTDSEAPGLAIALAVEDAPFSRLAPLAGSATADVRDRREVTIGGRRAVRVETVATGGGLLPAGTRGVAYYVDLTAGTLVATTSEVAESGTLATNAAVLDAMMASLTELDPATTSCSAAARAPALEPQPGLPGPVASTRQAIVNRAVACDYEGLAALALRTERPFTYSFGGRGEPAEFWQQAEAEGDPVLGALVEVLSLPHATRTVDDGADQQTIQYVWPAAFGYEDWAAVPEQDREDLLGLYDAEDLARFAQFGAYVGHRVGITSAGEWIFFVAGD